MSKRCHTMTAPVCSFKSTADGYLVEVRLSNNRRKVTTLGPFATTEEAAAQAAEYLRRPATS